MPTRTIDLPSRVTLEYLIKTWLQPGAVRTRQRRRLNGFKDAARQVTALKAVLMTILRVELAF
jgi:hypothetical protein